VTSRQTCKLALLVTAVWFALPAGVRAHEKISIGTLQLTIGWSDEPAFAGSRNSVEVDVADASGSPVANLPNRLTVEVSFGDRRVTMPLLAAARQPGTFRASIIPTRVGTYAFRVTGRLKDQSIDVTSACSEKTFPCVIDPADLQFPEKDPSAGQLADRIVQSQPRMEQAIDGAAEARMLSFVSLAIAAVAVAATVAFRSLRSRTGRKSSAR
jgi:hypothetical protein